MFVGRALAFAALASRAVVGGTVLPAEVVAGSPVVVGAVEAFAARGGGLRFRIAEVGVAIYVHRERDPHQRDRKQSRHDDLTHQFEPPCTKPPSRVRNRLTVSTPSPIHKLCFGEHSRTDTLYDIFHSLL